MLWDALGCSGMLEDDPKRSKTLWDALGILEDPLGCLKMLRDAWRYFEMLWDALGCFEML